jgi:transcriptional regulator with XRE-family HTH domain
MAPLPGLGPALRAIRQAQGLSLTQAGEQTGLSKSFLSLVEQGKSDITLGRLMRLVKFYNVGLADLLPEDDVAGQRVAFRPDQRTKMALEREGLELTFLAIDRRRRMMPVWSTFAPGGHMENHALHEGDEFVWVLEGRLALEIDGSETVVLEAGDCAYFDASRAHRYENAFDGTSKAFAVISPPTL